MGPNYKSDTNRSLNFVCLFVCLGFLFIVFDEVIYFRSFFPPLSVPPICPGPDPGGLGARAPPQKWVLCPLNDSDLLESWLESWNFINYIVYNSPNLGRWYMAPIFRLCPPTPDHHPLPDPPIFAHPSVMCVRL